MAVVGVMLIDRRWSGYTVAASMVHTDDLRYLALHALVVWRSFVDGEQIGIRLIELRGLVKRRIVLLVVRLVIDVAVVVVQHKSAWLLLLWLLNVSWQIWRGGGFPGSATVVGFGRVLRPRIDVERQRRLGDYVG